MNSGTSSTSSKSAPRPATGSRTGNRRSGRIRRIRRASPVAPTVAPRTTTRGPIRVRRKVGLPMAGRRSGSIAARSVPPKRRETADRPCPDPQKNPSVARVFLWRRSGAWQEGLKGRQKVILAMPAGAAWTARQRPPLSRRAARTGGTATAPGRRRGRRRAFRCRCARNYRLTARRRAARSFRAVHPRGRRFWPAPLAAGN